MEASLLEYLVSGPQFLKSGQEPFGERGIMLLKTRPVPPQLSLF